MLRSLAVLVVLGTEGAAASTERMRETLLKEARERLTSLYEEKASLDPPFWRDGAQVQMSRENCLCDGAGGSGKVPLTFGQFDVQGARPVDVFNVLADWRAQKEWDPTVSQVKEIPGVWQQQEGVRALEMIYPAGIIFVPDREVFEYAAYRADFGAEEFWVAYSTLGDERLRQALEPASGAVAAQNCLGAYWIRKKADGSGSRVLFTQHVNPHPPLLISAKTVFAVSWGKQIDYINLLRKRAQRQSTLGWAADRTLVAPELLHELYAPWTGGKEQGSSGVFRAARASFYRLYAQQRPPLPALAGRPAASAALGFVGLLALAAAVLVVRRSRKKGEAASEEVSSLLEA